MPITYSIDETRKLILTRVTGALTIALTEDYFERLQQDSDCPEDAIEVVDFSGVADFAIHYGEMSEITRKYQKAKTIRNIRATIFNCPSDLSYGIGRMLQTLHEMANEKHTVIVTRSQKETDTRIEELRSHKPDAVDSE
jgi:hypothetical protein